MKFRVVLFLSIALVFVSCSHRTDKVFEFEKIEYHHFGAGCGGSCPTYHLSIDGMGKINLYSAYVYKSWQERIKLDTGWWSKYKRLRDQIVDSVAFKVYYDSISDKSRMGYFTGWINDSILNLLKLECSNISNDSVSLKEIKCYDTSFLELGIFYNGKLKQYCTNWPDTPALRLFSILDSVWLDKSLKRTDIAIEFKKLDSCY